MASVTVKEREWDTQSVRSHRPYATVRRYKIPEESDDVEDTRVVITDRHDHRGSDRNHGERIQFRHVERDNRGWSPPRSHRDVEEERITIRQRSRSRSSSSDARTRVSHRSHHQHDQSPYSLEKYSKSTEYFSQPAPQPIIIRERAAPAQQPIIIREMVQQPQQTIVIRERERPEPSYELIERPREREREQEEDYYYERRVRRVDRHRERDEEREWRRGRDDDRRGYHSDDEAIYTRLEYDEYGSRDSSPHHRRHIAEGVIAGIAASQVVRHHRKRDGRSPGSRVGQVLGYGALGGVGAEALARFNDRDRSNSRGPRDVYRGEDTYRGRERSRSLPRARTIAGVTALAGLGALAYAAGKKNNNKNGASRSRSRHGRSKSRRGRSRSSARSASADGTKHLDKDHRNHRTAQAGLVGAAAAGIAQAVRSRSRGGRSRSKSRVRQGAPIVAAGLGSAAIAGLYERQKGKKEAKELSRSRSRSVSRSRSRSRSRSVSRHTSRRATSDTGLVEYGGDPIPSSELARPRSRSRSHSRGRRHQHRSASSGSSPDRRRSRSRSNGVGLAAAAGAGAVAAHEVSKRRERRRERERRQREEEAAAAAGTEAPYASTTDLHQPYYPTSNEFAPPPSLPQHQINDGYIPQQHPNESYVDSAYGTQSIPPYNPAAYGPTSGPTLPHDDPYTRPYQPQTPNEYLPPQHDPYAPPLINPTYAARNDPRNNPENVSVSRSAYTHLGPDGLDGSYEDADISPRTMTPGTTRGHSPGSPPIGIRDAQSSRAKSVFFDEDPVESEHIITPLEHRKSRRCRSKSNDDGHGRHRTSDHNPSSHKRRRRSRDASDGRESDTDTTEDLPPRFDAQGKKLPERGVDPLADKVEDLLQSSFFQNITERLLGGGGGGRRR